MLYYIYLRMCVRVSARERIGLRRLWWRRPARDTKPTGFFFSKRAYQCNIVAAARPTRHNGKPDSMSRVNGIDLLRAYTMVTGYSVHGAVTAASAAKHDAGAPHTCSHIHIINIALTLSDQQPIVRRRMAARLH